MRCRPEEQWLPGKSTLLQVLVSIQSMILIEAPYFNEYVPISMNHMNVLLLSTDIALATIKAWTWQSEFETACKHHLQQGDHSANCALGYSRLAQGRTSPRHLGCKLSSSLSKSSRIQPCYTEHHCLTFQHSQRQDT